MSAEKLRGWSNPGWLTPAYRQSLLSLVHSNGNQQLVETNRNSIKYARMTGKSSSKDIFCSTHSKRTNVAFSLSLQLKCKSHMLETAFVQQQHHCSCLRELQRYRYNNSVCCVYCMESIFTLPCYCKQARVFGRGSTFFFFASRVFCICKCFIILFVWRAGSTSATIQIAFPNRNIFTVMRVRLK